MRMSDNKQKAMIHQLSGKLNLDKELYREILQDRYKVNSSKDLTYRQASDFISYLKKQALDAGVWERKKSFQKHKYSNLGHREGMASPKQLRMIEALWKEVSYVQDETARLEALNTFLSKHFGVDKLIWVESNMVGKVKRTLEQMKVQKAQKEEK
jgi:hypothetical protein